jgi:hypothetical protein
MYKISTENIGDVKKYVFHYRKGDKEYGPYTYEDIVELVQKGEIGPDDYVFRFGNRKFIKASEMEGLFDVEAQKQKDKVAQEDKPAEVQVINKEEIKNEIKGDFHIAFDNMPVHVPVKHKKDTSGLKIALIVAGLLAACLAIWGIAKIL